MKWYEVIITAEGHGSVKRFKTEDEADEYAYSLDPEQDHLYFVEGPNLVDTTSDKFWCDE